MKSWCDHDLRETAHVPADPDQQRAQLLLHQWATGAAEATIACGVSITHRIGFHAFLELIDAAHDGQPDWLAPAADPANVAAAASTAAAVLTQPTLDQASHAAADLLRFDGVHAPIGPAWRLRSRPHSPLLAAVQINRIRDRLSPTDQLMFRTAHAAPRYPAALTKQNRRRLRLPDHGPRLPEPSIAWIPQVLWPGALPQQADVDADRVVMAGAKSMALAKLGATRPWSMIVLDLGLPATHANRIGVFFRAVRDAGRWPQLLDDLDTLMDRLQKDPPPIDYQARRIVGDDTELLTAALEAAGEHHPDGADSLRLVRRFWELFTGGDIAFAPPPLQLQPGTRDHQQYRTTVPVANPDDSAVFARAHAALADACPLPVAEPLTWRPP